MRISPPARASARYQGPIIEVQDYGGIVILACFVWEIPAGSVLGGNQAQPQGADVSAVRQLQPLDHFRPGEHGVAGINGGRHVAPLMPATWKALPSPLNAS